MRRTGQFAGGHPHASAVLSKRSMKASGSSCGPILFSGMWVGGRGRCCSPGPNLPVHPAPEQLAVLLLRPDEGLEKTFLVLPHVQQRLMVLLVETRERMDDVRKRRTRRGRHDGSGLPSSFPGFGTSVIQPSFGVWKEEDNVGVGDSYDFIISRKHKNKGCHNGTVQ